MARRRPPKESRCDYVTLHCQRCGEASSEWELRNFMSQLGKEYRTQGYVLQYCCDGNTKHVIVGITTEHHKPRTPGQVFALHTRRKRKSKRLVDILS